MSNQQQNRQAPVKYAQPRIPYNPQFAERFGIDLMHWRLLVEQVFPAARTAEGILLAVAYCRARHLDIFKRPVHVVPIWDSQQGKEIESVWPGIGELRITAARTKLYAGKDQARFGPPVTHIFAGFTKKGGDQKIEITFPEWCQVTVYKMVEGQRCAFEGPKVYWMEAYARMGKSDLPNSMWEKRPSGQLEKCAEAAALRAAFPEEIGNEYIPEEIGGQLMRDITPPPRPKPEDYADGVNTSGEPVKESPESEHVEQQAEDRQQEESDFPGDKPMTGKKAEPKKKAAPKAEKPPQETENPAPDPNAKWKVKADAMSYLATFKATLRHTTAGEHVDAMLGVNSARIGELPQETQDAIFAAADERKTYLSQPKKEQQP